ncbi:hypothetical protein [Salininema proteolyticum]|uniref:Uncharacterized protein n=1 Tax=Salininema proteolyticum TaxID=1607685 RepID=A0ABV8U395_9ACTN
MSHRQAEAHAFHRRRARLAAHGMWARQDTQGPYTLTGNARHLLEQLEGVMEKRVEEAVHGGRHCASPSPTPHAAFKTAPE